MNCLIQRTLPHPRCTVLCSEAMASPGSRCAATPMYLASRAAAYLASRFAFALALDSSDLLTELGGRSPRAVASALFAHSIVLRAGVCAGTSFSQRGQGKTRTETAILGLIALGLIALNR